MPKVSVVIPSYNHADFIARTLASLEAQTFRNFDAVIVDDGSTDSSVHIIERFAEDCGFQITLIKQPNAGAHAAIERGIAAARGDLIAILNSDDLFLPERLRIMVEAAPSAGPFIAFSAFQFIDAVGREIPEDPHNLWYQNMLVENELMPGLGFTLLRGNISISTSNFLFSKAVHTLAGPFKPYRTAHDLDFLLRCLVHVEPVFFKQPLLQYRLHSRNTINANRDLERQEVREIVSNYIQEVSGRDPANEVAPGSRKLALYSEHFLTRREHWFGPCAGRTQLDALAQKLVSVATSADAQALRREVERLSDELLAQQSLLGEMERHSRETDRAVQTATERLQAVYRSTSWIVTRPLRCLGDRIRRRNGDHRRL